MENKRDVEGAYQLLYDNAPRWAVDDVRREEWQKGHAAALQEARAEARREALRDAEEAVTACSGKGGASSYEVALDDATDAIRSLLPADTQEDA